MRKIGTEKIIAPYEEEGGKLKQDSKSEKKEEETTIISVTAGKLKEICDRAAVIGAKEALKTFEQERKKEQGKRADR